MKHRRRTRVGSTCVHAKPGCRFNFSLADNDVVRVGVRHHRRADSQQFCGVQKRDRCDYPTRNAPQGSEARHPRDISTAPGELGVDSTGLWRRFHRAQPTLCHDVADCFLRDVFCPYTGMRPQLMCGSLGGGTANLGESARVVLRLLAKLGSHGPRTQVSLVVKRRLETAKPFDVITALELTGDDSRDLHLGQV